MEPSENAYPFLIQASIENLVRADMLRMPFRRESFDAVVSLDVLCVFQESDIPSSIREIVNVMKPDGRIILNLPAYPWLMSGHDRFVGNKSRFTARGVSDELTKAGLIIKYQGYRNSILFPFVAAARLLSLMKMSLFKRYAEPFQSDVKMPPEWINRILTRILLFENYFICRGWRFCFGLSVIIVAQKSGSEVGCAISDGRDSINLKGLYKE